MRYQNSKVQKEAKKKHLAREEIHPRRVQTDVQMQSNHLKGIQDLANRLTKGYREWWTSLSENDRPSAYVGVPGTIAKSEPVRHYRTIANTVSYGL